MANNAHVNEVIYGNEVLISLKNDTVTADKLANGYTAHGADGSLIVGEAEFSNPYFDGDMTVLLPSARFVGDRTILEGLTVK